MPDIVYGIAGKKVWSGHAVGKRLPKAPGSRYFKESLTEDAEKGFLSI